jgi:uncharacterized integral membrane protein
MSGAAAVPRYGVRFMIRRLGAAVVLVPLAVLLVLLAMANRQGVTLSYDLFLTNRPAFASTAPLFVILFGVLLAGVILGGAAVWLRQGRWRRAARHAGAEARTLRIENDRLRAHVEEAERRLRDNATPAIGYRRSSAA